MREPRATRLLALWAASLLWLVGCDDEPPTHVQEVLADRPEEAEQVGAAVAAAPSEACARDLADQTPDAVRATIADLGYASLFDDACLAARAEREATPALCQGLSVSTLRERCVARVAISSGRPGDCPPARTLDGRDPLCVALAAHDRRLCVVASVLERSACEAALGHAAACAHLPESERENCRARAADLGARVHGDPITRPALETSMDLVQTDGTSRALSSAERGARIGYRGCARVLVLGEPGHLTAPFGHAGVAFEVTLADEEPTEATLTSLPTEAASTLSATLDGMRVVHASGGTLSLTRMEPELGGAVEGSFHATYAGASSVLEGTFTTFVRDVDPPPASCASAAPSRE